MRPRGTAIGTDGAGEGAEFVGVAGVASIGTDGAGDSAGSVGLAGRAMSVSAGIGISGIGSFTGVLF